LPKPLLFNREARFYHNINQNAVWYLIITERRVADLAVQAGTTNQYIALQYLDEAVNAIAELLSHAPDGSIDLVNAQLTATLKQAKVVVAGLTPISSEDAQYIAMVEAKISTFLMLVTNQDMAALKGIPHLLATMGNQNLDGQIDRIRTLIAPLIVPFPEGSAGWNHAFYSLIGGHAAVDCETCHMDGNYQGTPQACQDCHLNLLPVDHYPGDCAACHNPSDWLDVYFDHNVAEATDCVLCHTDEVPTNHYAGQCSNCHNATAWKPASFNHRGFTDCQTCHTDEKPANHYAGQCSSCHSSTAWKPADFNHSGFSNCTACHNAPAHHYAGVQCSACHSNNAWRPANFNHSGFKDCQACHNRPSDHDGGQCSQCHSVNNWKFNHSAQSNCVACHSGHKTEQCSNCHNTRDWDDADDDDGGDEPDEPDEPDEGD
jgi:hypothetical protein